MDEDKFALQEGVRHRFVARLEEGQGWGASLASVGYSPGNGETVPLGDVITAMPVRDLDVACAVDHEADLEVAHALEVIGAHVATLVDTRLSAALDSESQDEVRCLVARAVTPKLAQLIVVTVESRGLACIAGHMKPLERPPRPPLRSLNKDWLPDSCLTSVV